MTRAFQGLPAGAPRWFTWVAGEPSWSTVERGRAEHDGVLRAPMAALVGELSAEFGPASVWHLHRATWLWHHTGAAVTAVDNIGFEVRLSLDELSVTAAG